jgi:hypothetical protein
MTVLITLSGVGSSAGPTFNLYASPDGITFTTIVLGVNKTALEAGYTATVPNGTTDIKVTSVGACTNSYIATIGVIPTTTTTTTIGVIPTTTTTTTIGVIPTTTTTTTATPTTTSTTTLQVFTQGLDQSSAYCVGGFCELDGTITGITVYSLDETLVTGSFIYTDPALTIPYTTTLVSDGQYIFNVSGFGELTITCTVGIEC